MNLKKLQKYYYDAAMANANVANQSMAHLQSSILTLILAELAFLGIVDLSRSDPPILSIVAAALLIVSAFCYIFGAKAQWNHTIRSARGYFVLSKRASELIKILSLEEIDELPEFLNDNIGGLKTNKNADYFIWLSILILLLASVLILTILFSK